MRKLQQLDLWRVARELSRAAYGLTMIQPLARHFGLSDQIRRSAMSIPANIAEGYGLGTKPQLVRCLRIALGSTYELRTHLEFALDLGLTAPDHYRTCSRLCDRMIALLLGSLRGLGSYFKP